MSETLVPQQKLLLHIGFRWDSTQLNSTLRLFSVSTTKRGTKFDVGSMFQHNCTHLIYWLYFCLIEFSNHFVYINGYPIQLRLVFHSHFPIESVVCQIGQIQMTGSRRQTYIHSNRWQTIYCRKTSRVNLNDF